jgi:PAS domain-containing protein/anti-sigma regulatory factor (Ser/Thr protein kinase)
VSLSRPSRRRARPKWLTPALAVALLLLLALVDLFVRSVLLVPLFVLAPVVLALLAGPAPTAVAGVAAFALALVAGAWNGSSTTAAWAVAVVLVGAGALAAFLGAVARERFRRDARRLEILVGLGDAGSASAQQTAVRLCELVVPAIADACVIQLGGEDDRDAVSAARVDAPHDPRVAYEVRRVRRFADGGGAGPDAARLVDPVTDESLTASAADDAALEALRSLALRSCVYVPLCVSGRRVGEMWMGVGLSGRRFSGADVRFGEVLADRVAMALENAGLSAELFDAQRRFEAIVDGMLDGVTVRAADGNLVYANNAAIDMLRVGSRDELQRMARGEAMALFDVYAEDGSPVTLAQLPGARAWHTTEDPAPMIVRNVVRATGEERWLLSKAMAIRDAAGRPEYVVNFTEDVTAVKRAELAQRVLAEAGRVLVSSLDVASTLQQVARLAVPALADWCGVDMPGRGVVEPVAVSHVDPEKVRVARRLRESYAVRADEPAGLAAVIRGDIPHFLVDETPDEALAAYAADEEHLALLRAVGFNSIMIVPVVGRSGVIGALTLVSSVAHRFDDDDLELATELGRRTGVAVENARLHSERADIAHTLQVALVPDPAPLAPGWDVAALYRPAGEAAEAGGDFYDMVRTDAGWLVVMGDVTGKGAGAASLTALARYTLRTAAMLTGDPRAALTALNVGLMRRSDVAYCTAVLVSLEETEDGARARVLSAGHPLPVLLRGGIATPVGRSGPLLGAIEAAEWPSEELLLGPGDRFVLYTDGVTDARGPEDRFGDDRLLELLSSIDGAPPADVVDAVERALRSYQDGPQRDDTAILAVGRLHPGELALPGVPESVGLARAAVRARLEDHLPPERLGDAALLTSEVVTNAIRHGGAHGPGDRVRVRVTRAGARVRVEVRDDGPGFASPRRSEPGAGMGLELVASLANAWGSERDGGTTVVWFEVDPRRPDPPVH